MFKIDQIGAAHSKVKSGADFPAYIQELKRLGVIHYQTFVVDGRTDYYGASDYRATSPAKYSDLVVAAQCEAEQFKAALKEHQQGKTDYPTFIRSCAECGIENWIVDLAKMTCTYHDKSGNEVLVEAIPQ
ncbi:MAG TPA: DUF1398 family protein [Cyclobacteriaceae bacterium]|nr:DUF1398 family protein [Cyclobacteriaceae bacterium]